MITVKDILSEKGSKVWTVSPEAKVLDALKMMAERGVGALIVFKDDDVVGIISERDYARKVILMGRHSQDTKVSDIMTSPVYGVHLDTHADECMALMTDKHIRHLPVCKDGQLVGVVSIGDVVKAIMGQQKVTIENLENYIMGKYQ
jgi:CBS domain-containing protein